MQLMQEYDQKSTITTLPRSAARLVGSEFTQPTIPFNSGAAPMSGRLSGLGATVAAGAGVGTGAEVGAVTGEAGIAGSAGVSPAWVPLPIAGSGGAPRTAAPCPPLTPCP